MALIPRWRGAPPVHLVGRPLAGAAFLPPLPPGVVARPYLRQGIRGWRGGGFPRRGGASGLSRSGGGGGGGGGGGNGGGGGGCGGGVWRPPPLPTLPTRTRSPPVARLPWPMPSWRPRVHRSSPSPSSPTGRGGAHRERRRGRADAASGGPPSSPHPPFSPSSRGVGAAGRRGGHSPPRRSGGSSSRSSSGGGGDSGGIGGGRGFPFPPPPPPPWARHSPPSSSPRHVSGLWARLSAHLLLSVGDKNDSLLAVLDTWWDTHIGPVVSLPPPSSSLRALSAGAFGLLRSIARRLLYEEGVVEGLVSPAPGDKYYVDPLEEWGVAVAPPGVPPAPSPSASALRGGVACVDSFAEGIGGLDYADWDGGGMGREADIRHADDLGDAPR
ncbi:hypothetical protein MMPV_006841 [Pyropia vietnamensis]